MLAEAFTGVWLLLGIVLISLGLNHREPIALIAGSVFVILFPCVLINVNHLKG